MKTAEEVGRAVLERFSASNRERQASGAVLRAEIRELLRTHVGPAPATGKRIRARLSRSPLPSLRVVQWHLQALKNETPR